MKKFISLISVALIIFTSLCFGMTSASASSYDDWVLGEDAEYLTHDGDTYFPVFTDAYLHYGLDTHYSTRYTEDLEFTDDETEAKYAGSSVTVSTVGDVNCVEVFLESNVGWCYTVIYVKEGCMEEYENLLKGEGAGYFVNAYVGGTYFYMSKEELESCKEEGAVTVPASRLYQYDMNELFVYDKSKQLSVLCGYALVDAENNEAYILHYSQYDSKKLYGEGDTLTIYEIKDTERRAQLIEYCNSSFEDELEWMNPGPVDINLVYVIGVALFCVVPVLVLGFSVTMFFVLKNRSYRKSLVIMGVGSILMLLAFVLFLIFI